jgi:glucoamylase
MGTPIGRYPEDTYDGVGTNSLGNPWYLTTAALGEYHFLRAHKLMRSDPVRGEREAKLGGSFVRRIQYHTPVDLALAEQYSRWDGYAMGAVHLTWSYASMLSMDRALRTGMTKPIPVKR